MASSRFGDDWCDQLSLSFERAGMAEMSKVFRDTGRQRDRAQHRGGDRGAGGGVPDPAAFAAEAAAGVSMSAITTISVAKAEADIAEMSKLHHETGRQLCMSADGREHD